MTSRALLGVFLAVVLLIAFVWGGMHWWSAWALAQLTPVGDVRWDGYVIEHHWRWHSDLGSDGDFHQIRVLRDRSPVLDEIYYVRDNDLLAGPAGFFGGLNVDDDDDLELVFCQDGVIEYFLEPDPEAGGVRTQPGARASADARALCGTVDRAGSRPALGCVMCCAFPIAVPAFIGLLFFARRERREEQHTGRSTF